MNTRMLFVVNWMVGLLMFGIVMAAFGIGKSPLTWLMHPVEAIMGLAVIMVFEIYMANRAKKRGDLRTTNRIFLRINLSAIVAGAAMTWYHWSNWSWWNFWDRTPLFWWDYPVRVLAWMLLTTFLVVLYTLLASRRRHNAFPRSARRPAC